MATNMSFTKELITSLANVNELIACGKVLDRQYWSLLGLEPYTDESVSPQDFCQTLVDYVLFAHIVVERLLKQNPQTSIHITREFIEKILPNESFILQFNKKYGDLNEIASCKAELINALAAMGEFFSTNRIQFENFLKQHDPILN